MLNENIKKLRMASGYTQKELADMLHVTAQAVSRWESGDVEPSIGTISEMAKIFKVTTDELINGTAAIQAEAPLKEEQVKAVVEQEVEKEVEKRIAEKEQKPVLAVCEQCNRPIYSGSEIVRVPHYTGRNNTTYSVICKDCDTKNKNKAHAAAVAYGEEQRRKSFIWGGIAAAAALIVSLYLTISNNVGTGGIVGAAVASVLLFPFISCLLLRNNFIGEMVMTVASWGFVKFPGLIFSLDLDGIIWLLTVKLAFWILGFMIAAAMAALAIALGLALSIFVYPYAIKKSIEHPEATERF